MKHNGIRTGLVGVCAAALVCVAAGATEARSALPLSFEQNLGQTDSTVSFLARGPGYTVFLTPTESVMVLRSATAETSDIVDLRMKLAGSDPAAHVTGLDPLRGTASYFVGNDPKLWRKAIPTFQRVSLAGVYPGIDLVYYGKNGQLEYDFVVAPGSDPAKIRIDVEGAETIAIDTSGDLVLNVHGRQIRWHKPICYQEIGGARRPVEGSYERLADNRFGFKLNSYDREHALVIDPALVYATYLAPTSFGLGDGLTNLALAIATDAAGNAYVAGLAQSSKFPVTTGAFDTTRPGGYDVFVAKLNAAGSALLYSTYLGGAGTEVQNSESLSIAVDADGNAYVVGATQSADFPTTTGAYQTTPQGSDDAFVTKLSPDGASLVYSTYLGGTGIDYGWDVAVNGDGEAFVCGETNGNFPATPGAYQTTPNDGSAFVTKLAADGSAPVYSTLLGSYTGKAHSIAIDGDGNAYVTGYADTPHGATLYPVTEGAFQTTGKGSFDAFVTKLNAQGSALVYSSYLGGDGNEDGNGIAVDTDGNAYVVGNTNSTNFPATAGAYQTTLQSTPTPQDDGFVIKLDADGSSALFATYVGAAAAEDAKGIVVDSTGNVIIAGGTTSTNYPTTPGAFQETFTPASTSGAGYVTKLKPDGSALEYSTYVHPTDLSFSVLHNIAIDGTGAVYVAGSSGPTFPTTPGAFQTATWSPYFGGPIVAKFELAESATTCGDFSGDGRITAADALGVLRVSVESVTCDLSVCDVNGDSKITAGDALNVLRIAVDQPVVTKCPSAALVASLH